MKLKTFIYTLLIAVIIIYLGFKINEIITFQEQLNKVEHISNPVLDKFIPSLDKTIKIGNLEIAKQDFLINLTWDSAKLISQVLKNGWRLPNVKELDFLYINRNVIGGFTSNKYWSSDFHKEGVTAYEKYFNHQGFRDVSPYNSRLKVRFVRMISAK